MVRQVGVFASVCLTTLVAPISASSAQQSTPPPGQQAQRPATTSSDSVMLRVANTDLRTAVQLFAQYLDRPVVFTGTNAPVVTLETPRPIPRSDVLPMLRGLAESVNFELVDDTASKLYRVRPKEQPRPAAPIVPPQQQQGSAVELFVIHLKHARAADVASTINALFGQGSQSDRSPRRQTLSDQLRANQVPPADATPAPQAVPGTAGRSASLTGEVTIVPDARANSLLIRANRTDMALITAATNELDIRPLQALIEVLIAEVRRDRSLTFGVDASLPKTKLRGTDNTIIDGTLSGAGTTSGNSSNNNGSPGLGDFVLRVMGIGGVDWDASLRAAAGRGDVAIISRPVVVTANNEEAEIVVGSQRPFVQVSRALPTDAGVRDQIVQYKEVGTKLHVRPTISADGLVQLEVTQEVSNATEETAFNAPVISTRSVQTQLLVRDGQTVVLGGLTDRQKDVTQNGIPVLSSIPFLGGLFGRTSRRTVETELFVFLTPRVMRTDEDASKLSDPLQKRAERAKP
jgi:general secretion pathway protein D